MCLSVFVMGLEDRKLENWKICEIGNIEFWKFENLDVWHFEGLEFWRSERSGNLMIETFLKSLNRLIVAKLYKLANSRICILNYSKIFTNFAALKFGNLEITGPWDLLNQLNHWDRLNDWKIYKSGNSQIWRLRNSKALRDVKIHKFESFKIWQFKCLKM